MTSASVVQVGRRVTADRNCLENLLFDSTLIVDAIRPIRCNDRILAFLVPVAMAADAAAAGAAAAGGGSGAGGGGG